MRSQQSRADPGSWAFLSTRIGRRLLAVFIAASLVPLLVVAWFTMSTTRATTEEQTHAVLRAATDGTEAQLSEFLKHLEDQTLYFAQDHKLREILEISKADSSPTAALSSLLAHERGVFSDVQELFVVLPDGCLLASSITTNRSRDYTGADFFTYGQQGYFEGDVAIDPVNGRLTWVMAAPIRDVSDRHLLGVLAVRVDPRTLSDLTTGRRVLATGADTQAFRIGETGETYIVNRDRLMITESRRVPNSVLRVRVDTLPIRKAFEEDQELAGNYRDYRGEEVTGASMILRDRGWVVVTEMDFRQAFAPIFSLERRFLAVSIALALVAVFLAWSFTRRIIRPIQLLEESDRAFLRGDKAAAIIPEEGLPDDELGALVRTRNARVRALADASAALKDRTAELRDAAAELEHMSYSIIHEMRAPLRAMTGFIQVVLHQEGQALRQDSRDNLQRVKAAAARMDRLICDVLNYSELARGQLPIYRVNTSELLRGILETSPSLQDAKVSFPPALPDVQGNEALLTQCFSNLLANAVKFAEPGSRPEVEITGERNDGRVRIALKDNGVGIPQSMQARIFRLFQRGNQAGENTGVGLAIVRKAVERMGGQVGVSSEPGRGSLFWIELPAAV